MQKENFDARCLWRVYSGSIHKCEILVFKVVVKGAMSNMVKAFCPLHNDIDNLFAFEQEVRVAINSPYRKYCIGQSSLE